MYLADEGMKGFGGGGIFCCFISWEGGSMGGLMRKRAPALPFPEQVAVSD